jgi:hypothetical protein
MKREKLQGGRNHPWDWLYKYQKFGYTYCKAIKDGGI